MNQFYAQQFASDAVASGIPREKVAALLKRASEISHRRQAIKTAGADIVGNLIRNAGMHKTASSVAYTHGLLKEAFDNGASLAQAYSFTSKALDATNKNLAFMSKVAEIRDNPILAEYAEGFVGSAKQAGMTDDAAIRLLVEVVDNEKRAYIKRADDGGMFKSPAAPDSDPTAGAPPGGPGGPGGDPSQGGPGGDPSQGGPGGDPSQGGSQEEQQLIQLLQSLPPEEQQQIIQQIVQQISAASGGGQGGPGGPGGPTPGAGSPPAGAGGPPPGGPQGPA